LRGKRRGSKERPASKITQPVARTAVLSAQFEADLAYWNQTDEAVTERLLQMMEELLADPLAPGIGKPERLRGNLRGYCSRRLTIRDRLIYRITNTTIEFASARFHYE
jgi:toxin YoeB